jgi:hypothetical protein
MAQRRLRCGCAPRTPPWPWRRCPHATWRTAQSKVPRRRRVRAKRSAARPPPSCRRPIARSARQSACQAACPERRSAWLRGFQRPGIAAGQRQAAVDLDALAERLDCRGPCNALRVDQPRGANAGDYTRNPRFAHDSSPALITELPATAIRLMRSVHQHTARWLAQTIRRFDAAQWRNDSRARSTLVAAHRRLHRCAYIVPVSLKHSARNSVVASLRARVTRLSPARIRMIAPMLFCHSAF